MPSRRTYDRLCKGVEDLLDHRQDLAYLGQSFLADWWLVRRELEKAECRPGLLTPEEEGGRAVLQLLDRIIVESCPTNLYDATDPEKDDYQRTKDLLALNIRIGRVVEDANPRRGTALVEFFANEDNVRNALRAMYQSIVTESSYADAEEFLMYSIYDPGGLRAMFSSVSKGEPGPGSCKPPTKSTLYRWVDAGLAEITSRMIEEERQSRRQAYEESDLWLSLGEEIAHRNWLTVVKAAQWSRGIAISAVVLLTAVVVQYLSSQTGKLAVLHYAQRLTGNPISKTTYALIFLLLLGLFAVTDVFLFYIVLSAMVNRGTKRKLEAKQGLQSLNRERDNIRTKFGTLDIELGYCNESCTRCLQE